VRKVLKSVKQNVFSQSSNLHLLIHGLLSCMQTFVSWYTQLYWVCLLNHTDC